MGFAADLNKLCERAGEKAALVVRRAALELQSGMIERSPVDTGRFKGNWQCGIGTIWTAEPLFVRRIWPWTPAGEVTDPVSLLMTARELMTRSLEFGPRNGWVHARAGQPCRRCGTPIACDPARRPPMERPVFWCPGCQAQPTGVSSPPRP